jgi:probable HAF family extracellular repeat protein
MTTVTDIRVSRNVEDDVDTRAYTAQLSFGWDGSSSALYEKAGTPPGTTASCGNIPADCDTAPTQSPVLVPGVLQPGSAISFTASGTTGYGPAAPQSGPDGLFSVPACHADGVQNGFHGFLWTRETGKMLDLGTLDYASVALGINDRGEVVGASLAANFSSRAFLWQKGVMTDLNSLIRGNSGLYLQSASSINSRGRS